MKLTLAVGTKNWSSWSLRGWLPVKLSGLPFEEQYVRLRHDDTEDEVKKVSPSGLVPLLTVEDGDTRFQVWDSLAIAEFMAEIAPRRDQDDQFFVPTARVSFMDRLLRLSV